MKDLDWRAVITDPRLIQAFEALEDPRWDWRTARAVAEASGLSEAQVAQLPVRYPSLVRKSPVSGPAGGFVYTLQSKYFAGQNPIQKALTFLSGSPSTSTPS